MIQTTQDLMDIIDTVIPAKLNRMAAAARIFQSLRIIVNDELHAIEDAFPKALRILSPQGRLVALTFHSLEDRMVKRFMRDQSRGIQVPRGVPITESQRGQRLRLVGKAVRASAEEVAGNTRSRSAIMRIAERIA